MRYLLLLVLGLAGYMLWRRHGARLKAGRQPTRVATDASPCPRCGVHSIRGAVNCNQDDCPLK